MRPRSSGGQLELAAASDGRRAVAYYDLTFSPAKSVSVYYAALLAAGDVEGAAAVAAAHDRAVEVAMAYAEEHVAYTRTGYHGRTQDGRSVGRYEAGEGLVWTRWRHSTNRESEPQLHTHVGVLNRLRTLSDGVIRALDGRGFAPVKEAIATAYDRALEEELVRERGVVFADRPDGKAREIVGVDPELCAEASTRRAQTLAKAEELTALYVARNGREPDAAARKAILHDAAMATRKPKEGRGRAGGGGRVGAAAGGSGWWPRWRRWPTRPRPRRRPATPMWCPGLRLDPAVPEQRARCWPRRWRTCSTSTRRGRSGTWWRRSTAGSGRCPPRPPGWRGRRTWRRWRGRRWRRATRAGWRC